MVDGVLSEALGVWESKLVRLFDKAKFLIVVTVLACETLFTTGARAVDSVLINCVETPGISDMSGERKPEAFNLSNNLARQTGSPVVADGEVIYLVGRVTDSKCNPVPNVNVFVWQSDHNGVYSGNPGYDEKFSGSGKATTDNLGNFGFITVMPGRHMSSDPRIHFLIKHPAFPDFQTEMFFEGMGNSGSSHFSRIPDEMKDLLTARYVGKEDDTRIYGFNLTFADGVRSSNEHHE
ncbi:MAG: protocatechuate 3,4-dioxygenase [Aaplasma endosymbiont of Hyalomma asiaticum]